MPLAPGFATFRFVTHLAWQASCQVLADSRNVANPWSLGEMWGKLSLLQVFIFVCLFQILELFERKSTIFCTKSLY
ncbi:hypothetical protein EHQ81_11950 [Leptospira selangorensis]|uniref:Uncharacterized protein n=1 Tax=Leptospira selangorensis TaxID=2484982 RepID=A0A5F2C2W4_9LEPT|nr:hypothetical protein EHQ81_11950 [Leptospira selangorensis]TGM22121.1 hypothetical protein EHQ82_06775 [Leptospira selangorensis]